METFRIAFDHLFILAIALILTLAYLPFFAVMAHQAIGPGGAFTR